MRERPDWPSYFLGLARVIARRSPDEQTQHGTVIAGPDNRIISVGYNGFPRHLENDQSIPCERPEKYPWMIHSEINALASANCSLEKAVAYVTGRVCFNCLITLWQFGVREIWEGSSYGWTNDDSEKNLRADFLRRTRGEMSVWTYNNADLSWIAEALPSTSRPDGK